MIKKLHLINQNKIILDALQKLDKLKIKVLFVVDKNNKIIGSLSEGDIRRSLIKGFNVKSSILPIVNLKPDIIKNSELKNIKNIKKQLCYPIVDNKERIIDVIYYEDLDTLNSNSLIDNAFFIFAGGKGKRLLPITKNLPKSMVKIDGKPILKIILNDIIKQKFVNIFISINYKKEIILRSLKQHSKKLNINFIEEKIPLGTAGSLGHIKGKLTKPFFIINSDSIYNINYSKVLDYFYFNKSDFVIVGHSYNFKIPYGELKFKKNLLKSIVEKPEKKYLVASGIYLASPKIIKFIKYNKYLDMPDLINIILKKGMKIHIYKNNNYWHDITDLESLKSINTQIGI